MSLLTVTTLLLIALSVAFRRGLGAALALGGATPAGAFVMAGALVIPTFYGVALAALLAVVATALLVPRTRRTHSWVPGVPLLVAMLAWAALVTALAPMVFNGLPIVTPTAVQLVAGRYTSSNIAQTAYFVLGVGVVAYLARARGTDASVVGLAVGTSVWLSAWRYTGVYFGAPFPEGVLDNSPSFVFIQTAVGGADRFRGIFSEPSSLAASCLVCIAYFLVRQRVLRGARRAVAWTTIAVAVFLGAVSTSTTFFIAGALLAGLAVVVAVLGFLSRRSLLSDVAAIGVVGVVALGIFAIPVVTSFAQSTIESKLAGASFGERSGSDSDSITVFLNTFGMGVGVGAGRGSSLLPTLLSTIGIVGVLLLVATIVLLIGRTAHLPAARPAIWALVTVLVAKGVAGADLADPSGLVWLCLGVLAHHAATQQRWPNLRQNRPSTRTLSVNRLQ